MKKFNKIKGFNSIIIIIFLSLAFVILITSNNYVNFQKQKLKKATEKELIAVASLKAHQIQTWRKQKAGDAQMIYGSEIITENFKALLNNPLNNTIKTAIIDYLNKLISSYSYNKFILYKISNYKNDPLIIFPDQENSHEYDKEPFFKECIETKKVVFTDLYKEKNSRNVYLSILVPFLDINKNVNGILLMTIDPKDFLFPLIKSWPTSNKTAESFLVRRENDKIVYLNELKNYKDSTLNIEFPIKKNSDMLSVQAVLDHEGLFEGNDHRNISVLSYILKVPDTKWFLIAKLDKNEIFSSMIKISWAVRIAALLFVILSGILLSLFWNKQSLLLNAYEKKINQEKGIIERRFDYLSKYANDMIILTDDKFNVIEVNDKALEVYGYPKENFLSMSIKKIRADNYAYPYTQEKGVSYKSQRLLFEAMHVKKDGTVFPVEISAKAITVDNKNYFQEIIRDITDRKIIEEEIKKLNAELEKKVLERTEELRSANRELEAFSYSVSHDLRSPLRAISNFANIILEESGYKFNNNDKKYFGYIIKNASFMGNLIDDLLAFSRTGRLDIVFSEIDIKKITSEVFLEIKEQYREHKINFILKDLPKTSCDRAMIKIVLTNLLSNAVKFSSKKDKIVIEAGYKRNSNKIIYFIKDNGVGFDIKYKDKIFGVFQRLHQQSEFEGTGVGLALVHRIISKHGGEVWAESELNKGSVFYFSLPVINKN